MATIDQYKIKIDVDGEAKVKSLTKSLDGLGSTIAGIGFTAFIANALKMADAMNDIADATGLTAGYVKGLGNAIQQAGGEMNDVGMIVNKFYQNIDDLANGSDKAINAFAKLNIEQKDLLKTSRQDILGLTLKRLGEMGPGAERTALGIELFGKAFGKIDPKKLEEILKTQDFAKLDIEVRKAADAYQAMEDNILTLQQAVLATFSPLIGDMDNMRLSAEQAEKIIKILGITLGVVFAAKTISLIYETATAIRALAAAAALAGRNPLIKALALGSLAIGGLVAGKNLLEDEAATAPGAAQKPSGPAAANAAASTIEASQKEKAAKAAALQTAQMRQQLDIANKYRTILVQNAGLQNEYTDALKQDNAVIEQLQNDVLNYQTKIAEEQSKGKDANEGLIKQYIEQLKLKQQQAAQSLILNSVERERLKIQKEYLDGIQKEATIETFNADVRLQRAKALLMLQEANGEITERQAQIGMKLAESDTKYLKEKITLVEKLEQARLKGDTAEINRILDLIKLNKLRHENEIKDIADTEAAETLRQQNSMKGISDAMEQIAKSFTPYKQAQDMIAATWGKLSSAVDTFVETGKFKFKDFAASVIQDIAKIIIKAQLLKAIQGTLGFFGISLPGFAEGGNVKGNKPILVGEKGPELFVPPSSGKIIPNNQLGKGMGTGAVNAPVTNNYNTYNINALDSKSVAQVFAENRKAIFGANKMAEREMSYAGAR